jgi:hypothetical protein
MINSTDVVDREVGETTPHGSGIEQMQPGLALNTPANSPENIEVHQQNIQHFVPTMSTPISLELRDVPHDSSWESNQPYEPLDDDAISVNDHKPSELSLATDA